MEIIHIQDDSWLIWYYSDLFQARFTGGKSFKVPVKFSIFGIHVTIIDTNEEITISYNDYDDWQDSLPEFK